MGSSLCASQTIDDKELIKDLLNATNINKFQFTVTISTSAGLHNLSFTLENHTYSLAEEYSKLMEYLSDYSTDRRADRWLFTTFPSVVALTAETSDIEVILPKFNNLRILYLTLILITRLMERF